MRARILAAACATTAMLLASAPTAQAADFSDCPGVSSNGPGRYVLTKDAACDLGLLGDDARVNLAGRTLSSTSAIEADRVVLVGGKLRTDGIFWLGSGGRMERLDVSVLGVTSPDSFLIEAGDDFTVSQSHFHDIKAAVAVDFFFGSGGQVSHSTFSGTLVGVSVQQSSGVAIKHNKFVSNGIGISLFNEDNFGVNNITVSDNSIANSTAAGIQIRDTEGYLTEDGIPVKTFENTRILDNSVTGSGASGIDVRVTCLQESDCSPTTTSMFIVGNKLDGNGHAPTDGNARNSAQAAVRAPAQGLIAHSAADQSRVAASAQAPTGSGAAGTLVVGDVNDTNSDDGITARAFAYDDATGDYIVSAGEQLGIIRVAQNKTSNNADRGIDAVGVKDGGGNTSRSNVNPTPCLGVICRLR